MALLEVRLRVEEAQVVVERELHVHVEHDAARQEEREVRDAPAAFDRDLLAVLDALDEAGEREHVLGHALAPLAAGLRARQRLAQALRRAGELREPVPLLAHDALEHVELRAALLLELGQQLGDAPELAAHRLQLRVDDLALAVELRGRPLALARHERAVRVEQLRHRGLALLRGREPRLARDRGGVRTGRGATHGQRRHDRAADERQTNCDNEHEKVHAQIVAGGWDTNAAEPVVRASVTPGG